MSRKLRVIVNAIPAANPITGIGRYVLELYKAMEEAGGGELDIGYFDGRVVRPSPPSGPTNIRAFSVLGAAFWRLPVNVALAIRLTQLRLREGKFVSLSRAYDVYHETAFFPFRSDVRGGVLQTIHDLSVQFHPEWHPAERVAFADRHFRQRLAWADELLTVSEFTREELSRFDATLRSRTTVTPLGVSNFSAPDKTRVETIKQQLELPDDYLLFVGSGDPRKNTRFVVDLIERERITLPLVIVGWSGWLPTRQSSKVRVLGYVDDSLLPGLYAGAAALLFPSLYEGFGLPVLEAMACGTAVIIPRAHSMPEVAGPAGYYFSPGDTASVENAVERVVSDKEERDSRISIGYKRAKEFTWRRTAELTLAALERAAVASKIKCAEK